jgi:RNA-directed DNA polymerase
MEAGILTQPETGVVQGGGMAPLCAHIFLQEVRDEWFEREGRPRMQGRCFLMRFADDFVIGCALAGDARRMMAVLPKRFARFGWRMHPTKTALLAVGRPEARPGADQGNGTCDFLGLTHDWARSRRGFGVITRRTARKRLGRAKKAWWRWCHTPRHTPLQDQYHMLCLKRRGHFRDDGLRGNFRLLEEVRRYAEKAWRYGLRRRSSKTPTRWEKCQKLLETSVRPTPKIVHNL